MQYDECSQQSLDVNVQDSWEGGNSRSDSDSEETNNISVHGAKKRRIACSEEEEDSSDSDGSEDIVDDGKRYEYWCFTMHNYPADILTLAERFVEPRYCRHVIFQPEICPKTKRKHLQGAIALRNKKGFGGVRLMFKQLGFPATRICRMDGTYEQSIVYCSKEESRDLEALFAVQEYGERPAPGANAGQGTRSDLIAIGNRLAAGAPVREVAVEFPSDYIRYHGGINALASIHNSQRTWVTEIFWYYGPTGTGKTRDAYALAPNAYFKQGGNKWWCGYDKHEDVIIDDYRLDLCPFNQLLRLFDRYPMQVERKGSSCQFVAKRIFITCPMHPQEIWSGRTVEDIQQLMRRIGTIKFYGEEGKEYVPHLAPVFNPI